jgi:uncharacterized protein YaaN involved in tellurite resistance
MGTTYELQGGRQFFSPTLLARLGDDATDEAGQLADQLVRLAESEGQARSEVQDALRTFGEKLQFKAARQSDMLKQPLRQLSERAGLGAGVADTLVDLKMQVEVLDPAGVDFAPGWLARLAGYLPFIGTPVKRYFSRYESASTTLSAIVKSLEKGREELKRDNITLRADQDELQALVSELDESLAYAQAIDGRLSQRLAEEIPADAPLAAFVRDELLFSLRQRIQDLQQQLLVSQQGVLTSALIVRNNEELIRGVNRALTVTVNALSVAVTLALALANQRIVLDKIEAVNRSTEKIIGDSAKKLREQGGAIHRQAASAQLDVEVLRQAFVDIRAALDDIAGFRRNALPEMSRSIATLDQLTVDAAALVQRLPAVASPV